MQHGLLPAKGKTLGAVLLTSSPAAITPPGGLAGMHVLGKLLRVQIDRGPLEDVDGHPVDGLLDASAADPEDAWMLHVGGNLLPHEVARTVAACVIEAFALRRAELGPTGGTGERMAAGK